MGPPIYGGNMSIDNVQGNDLLRRALSRRKQIIAWCAILGVIAGCASYFLASKSYLSTSTVFLNPLVGNPFSPTTPTSRTEQLAALTTESGVVLTDEVIASAILTSGIQGATPQNLRQNTVAEVPSNSQVMDISFTSSTPENARLGAEALTKAFLDFRTERAKSVIAAQSELLASREKLLAGLQSSANQSYNTAKSANAAQAAVIDLQQQVSLYAQELANVKVERTTNDTSAVEPGTVIGPATTPSGPEGINPLIVAISIFVFSLVIGFVLALLAEHADKRIRDGQDLRRHGAPQALGILAGPMRHGQLKERAIEHYLAIAPVVEQLVSRPGSVTLVGRNSSAELHALAIGLGVACAVTGRKVCLISTAAINAKLTPHPGFSDLLAGESSLNAVTRVTKYQSGALGVISSGTREEQLPLLAQRDDISLLCTELMTAYDLVIFVVAEPNTVMASVIASSTERSILAVSSGRERVGDLFEATEFLEQRGANFAGSLLYSAPWVMASEKELVASIDAHKNNEVTAKEATAKEASAGR